MLEAVGTVYPEAKYQRCTVHFCRDIFSVVPKSKAKEVVDTRKDLKLKEVAKKIEGSVEETLTCMAFPFEHWTRMRTNNVIERLNREIRRRTRVWVLFPTVIPPSCWSVHGCAM